MEPSDPTGPTHMEDKTAASTSPLSEEQTGYELPSPHDQRSIKQRRLTFVLVLRLLMIGALLVATFGAGMGVGYLAWGQAEPELVEVLVTTTPSPVITRALPPPPTPTPDHRAVLPTSYTLATRFGDVGPLMIKAGAFDPAVFAAVYQSKGQPLTGLQQQILTEGSNETVSFDAQNSYFLLNFFWALGLTNLNPILTEGAMIERNGGQIDRYASTGGWTLSTIAITDLYASTPIVTLTPEQQALVEEVAGTIYRPCCDNHTAFPDCNHGMALLGLLQLMAAQGASVDEMFEAAKYANLFWFPQQSQEIATFVKVTEGQEYADADARMLVSAAYASNSGFRSVHQWLVDNGHLGQPQGSGNSCGV